MRSFLTGLECRGCCTAVAADRLVGPCPTCGQALLASYDLGGVRGATSPKDWSGRPTGLWRYRELLPVQDAAHIVSLGELATPILRLVPKDPSTGAELWGKDDGRLPTGSFKARGMAVAVSRALELGAASLFVPSAGNAALALSAYAARARVPARVYLPTDTSNMIQEACRTYGAQVVTVPGSISDAGRLAREKEVGRGSFDLSTLREPYRVEGKKTMALEIFDQMGPEDLPDVIVYPTGGGTGIVGMFKGFNELLELGWIDRVPRLMSVQSEGCAPLIRALRNDEPRIVPWDRPWTVAPGLLVPAPFSSERVLEAIRGSKGNGVTVTDDQILCAMGDLARDHGLSVSPEAAAAYAGLGALFAHQMIRSSERVLVYFTGTGLPFRVSELSRDLRSAGPGRPGDR
jgi:threonine synthase